MRSDLPGVRHTKSFSPRSRIPMIGMHASSLLPVLLICTSLVEVSSFVPLASPLCAAREKAGLSNACNALHRDSKLPLRNSPFPRLAMTANEMKQAASASDTAGDTRIVERALLRFSGADMESSLGKIERFDDQIMGGISQSTIIRGTAQSESLAEEVECGVFGGVVRPQGGGFAGCRTKILQTPLDLSGNTGVYLKVAGDGKIYKLNMRGSPTSNEMVYQAEFEPPQRAPSCSSAKEAFWTVRIPFSSFRLVKRSVPVPGSPPLPINSIYQMGLVMSKFSFGEDQFNPTFQPVLGPLAGSRVRRHQTRRRRPPLTLPDQDIIQDSLRYKATGKKRSWFSRLLLRRVRSLLKKRVASKRAAVAQELLEARKQGIRLSEWRKEAK